MVGKLPQEVRMAIYGRSHSEKRTFFCRNSKGESLSVNSRLLASSKPTFSVVGVLLTDGNT